MENTANLSPSSDDVQADKEASGSVVELLERIASVVLPIAVALYAVLYIGIEEVYAVFGISPQQAGIDQSVLFGRLMGTLVLVLLLGIPALGLIVGLGWLINKVTFGFGEKLVGGIRKRPWVAALIAALWCGATYWGFFNFVGDLDLTIMIVIAVGLGVLTFLVPFRLLRRKPVGRAGLKVLVGGLTGLGLGFLLILQLSYGAVEVQRTGQSNLLLDTLGFQDQWAILKNAEDDKPLYDGRWMMLLGESEGTYLFYDCDKLDTFRRPIETTNLGSLQLSPEREEGFTCGGLAEGQ
ncbi:PrgI family protein [Acrocarpospora pleiomorpha]|uniref:PrgI family protein n=1 Tax=Acrocarpospora pleiomorpha TaxID=90975 RepID=UPI001478E833|nr:PrgI family protein [Acrocarpospora pleiomorpha]